MKKLEIKKTRPIFIISVLKVKYWVVLVSSILNYSTTKTSLANKWMRKKKSSCSNSALIPVVKYPRCDHVFYGNEIQEHSKIVSAESRQPQRGRL